MNLQCTWILAGMEGNKYHIAPWQPSGSHINIRLNLHWIMQCKGTTLHYQVQLPQWWSGFEGMDNLWWYCTLKLLPHWCVICLFKLLYVWVGWYVDKEGWGWREKTCLNVDVWLTRLRMEALHETLHEDSRSSDDNDDDQILVCYTSLRVASDGQCV